MSIAMVRVTDNIDSCQPISNLHADPVFKNFLQAWQVIDWPDAMISSTDLPGLETNEILVVLKIIGKLPVHMTQLIM